MRCDDLLPGTPARPDRSASVQHEPGCSWPRPWWPPAASVGGDGATTSSTDADAGTSTATTAPSTSTTPPAEPSPTPTPDPDLVDGPAPAAGGEYRWFRVDEVRRVGRDVSIDLTAAVVDQFTGFTDRQVSIVTSSGLEVDTAWEPRELGTNGLATVTLDVPLPDEPVEALEVTWDGHSVDVPLPAEDGRLTWRAAPLRQAAIAATVLRDDTVLEVIPRTLRSEGLVTEVDADLVLRPSGFVITLCRSRAWDCRLEDSSGRWFPLIADLPELDGGARYTTTLRFLGELPADETRFTLVLEGSACPVCGGDPSHELPIEVPPADQTPTRVAAASLARPDVEVDQEIEDPETGARLGLGTLRALDDHLQLDVTANGGSDDLRLFDDAALVDDRGFRHTLLRPDVDVTVPADGDLAATLVFATPLDPATRELTLQLGPDERLTATIPVDAATEPDGDATGPPVVAPPPAADQGDRGDEADATEEPSPPPPAPEPETVTLASIVVDELPTTEIRRRPSVLSTIDGVSSPVGDTASAEVVEPDAAAEAERSLEELGAERTPDGLVVTLPETVLFDFDSADLRATADDTLADVAEVLTYYDQAEIGVEGHTDGKGERDHNQDLSERRAQAVADALADADVATGRMEVVGYGMDRPIASNTTADGSDDPDGRQRNRRVEIVLREP